MRSGRRRLSLVSVVLAATLLANFSAPAAANEPHIHTLPDIALDGEVLLKSRDGTPIPPDRCRKSCTATAHCGGYTSFPDGQCTVFATVSGKVTPMQGASSGVVGKSTGPTKLSDQNDVVWPKVETGTRCPPGYDTEANTMVIGSDLELVNLPVSLERCADRCSDTKSCAGFVWSLSAIGRSRDESCNLKGKVQLTTSMPGATLCRKK